MSDRKPEIGLDARKAKDFGIGTYTRELVAAIAESKEAEDFRFVLFIRGEDRELFSGLPGNFSFETANFPGYSLSELTSFARLVRRRRLALFHALHYVLPPFLATRSVVTVHDLIHLDPRLSSRSWAYPYARFMLGSSLSRARAVITGSNASRQSIVERFPAAAGKIAVVPHGVAEEFRPGPDPEGLAGLSRRYDLPQRYALFLGGDRPHKNLLRVLEAFLLAVRDGDGLGLVLAGPLPRDARVRKLLAAPELSGRTRILGVVPQKDLPGLYRGAVVFLCPTLEEGFGLPALEAMGSGTPVIASAIPVWRETCGDAALLVEPRDPRAIAAAIARVAGSPEERVRLRDLGLQRAARFSWRETAKKTAEIYGKALREGTR